MRIPLALAALLAVAPAAHAQQATPSGAPFQAHATAPAVQTVSVEAKRASDPVRLDAPADSEDAVREQLPQRGSFWWVVGAIVVGGVILAVIL